MASLSPLRRPRYPDAVGSRSQCPRRVGRPPVGPRPERASGSSRCEEQGHHLADVQVDDLVGVHREWVCDRLTPSEADQLARTTRHNLAAVQRAREHPAAAT